MLGGSVGPRPSLTKLSNYTNVPHIGSNLIIFLIPSPDRWQVYVDIPKPLLLEAQRTPAPTPHQHWYHPRTCWLTSTACSPELTLKYRRRKGILKTREGICTGGLPMRQVKTTPPENRQVVPEKLSVVPQKNAARTGTIHLFTILFLPLNNSSQELHIIDIKSLRIYCIVCVSACESAHVCVFLFSCEGMNESSWGGPTLRGRLIWPGVFGLCQSARRRQSCSHNWPLCSKMSLLSKQQKESRRCLFLCFCFPPWRIATCAALNGRLVSWAVGTRF